MGSAVNLEKHILALLAAKGDVASGRAAASWALFAYEKSNELKLLDSGAGGPDELAKRFQSGNVMYGLCRLPDAVTGQQHIVLINWVGETVSEQRRQACASHLPAIRAFFKEASLVVKAGRAEEVTQDGLRHMVSLVAPPGGAVTKKAPLGDSPELVGTNYKKTNPALEILHTKRSSFWAQAEREEEERREEERRQAQAERRRWERQRMEEERREAAERERRVQEKERLVQEQRKQQAQLEGEERRREEARLQQQQREQEKVLSEQSPQSGSAEKAVAEHSRNPRDFFRQRERSGSAGAAPEPSSSMGGWPGTPRRPFLRHQRSLTESAHIFRRPDPAPGPPPGDSLPSAPLRAPLPGPRQPPSPPAVSPKPRTGPRSPTSAPERRPPSATSPPEGGAPVPATLLDMGGPSHTSPHPTPGPLAGAGLQALPSPSTPGAGDPLPEQPTPHGHAAGTELSPSPGSPPGPRMPDAPPQGTRPASPPQPPSLALSPEMGPVPPTEAPLPAAGPISSTCPPLAAPHEEAQPHIDSTGPASSWGPDKRQGPSLGPPPTSALPQEEDPARGDAPAPAPSQAESVPYSGHNGVAALEEGRRHGGQQELGPGGQGDSSADARVPAEAALGHPGAGDWAHNVDQASVVEYRGGPGDSSRHPAETTAA